MVDVLTGVVGIGEGPFVFLEGGDVGIAEGEDRHLSLKTRGRWDTNFSCEMCVCMNVEYGMNE